MKTIATLLFAAALSAGSAQAQSPSDVTEVTEGLIAVGMAIEIHKCPDRRICGRPCREGSARGYRPRAPCRIGCFDERF